MTLIFYFTPQKSFGKCNGIDSSKFLFRKTIAKNSQTLPICALFQNFWMRLWVAGRGRSAENSVKGCLWSHKISVQSTIVIVQKLTELFNKTPPLKRPFKGQFLKSLIARFVLTWLDFFSQAKTILKNFSWKPKVILGKVKVI